MNETFISENTVAQNEVQVEEVEDLVGIVESAEIYAGLRIPRGQRNLNSLRLLERNNGYIEDLEVRHDRGTLSDEHIYSRFDA